MGKQKPATKAERQEIVKLIQQGKVKFAKIMGKQKPAIKAERQEVLKLIQQGKVKFAGDISLCAKPANPEDDGKVVSVQINRAWDRRDSKGIVIGWGVIGCGFGELTFVSKKGKLTVDSECMGREFAKKILCALVDATAWDWGSNP